MAEIWDTLVGLLLHDRENEWALRYFLVLGVVGIILLGSRHIGGGGGGEGGDGGGGGC